MWQKGRTTSRLILLSDGADMSLNSGGYIQKRVCHSTQDVRLSPGTVVGQVGPPIRSESHWVPHGKE